MDRIERSVRADFHFHKSPHWTEEWMLNSIFQCEASRSSKQTEKCAMVTSRNLWHMRSNLSEKKNVLTLSWQCNLIVFHVLWPSSFKYASYAHSNLNSMWNFGKDNKEEPQSEYKTCKRNNFQHWIWIWIRHFENIQVQLFNNWPNVLWVKFFK